MGKTLTKRRWIAVIVAGIIAALFIVTAITSAVVYKKYQGRALPHTQVANIDVSGSSKADLVSAIGKAYQEANIELTVKDAKHKVSLADLGVKADAEKTAQNALARSSWTSYLSSLFKTRQISPEFSIDKEKTREYLNKLIPAEEAVGKPAAVSVNPENGEVTVADSVDGLVPDTKKLFPELEKLAKSPHAANIEVVIAHEPPEFDTAKAKELADLVTKKLKTKVELKAEGKTYAPSTKIASSFITVSKADNGVQSAQVNTETISQWVGDIVGKYNKKPVNGVSKVYENGELAQLVQKPVDGRKVVNTEDLLNSVVKAYNEDTQYVGDLKIETVKAQVVTKTVAKNVEGLAYAALPDEKWVDVNLTNHTATAYVGGQVVRGPVAMVNGSDKHPTVKGTYQVWAKVRSQTMRGPGYVTPGVPWILYFHGGYALHGAPWRSSFGYAGSRGSHGCINLPVSTAKWFYDWAEVGTTVVTHN